MSFKALKYKTMSGVPLFRSRKIQSFIKSFNLIYNIRVTKF